MGVFGRVVGDDVRLPGVPLLCLDGVQLPPGSYLDVAAPIAGGQVLPVVIKTLVF